MFRLLSVIFCLLSPTIALCLAAEPSAPTSALATPAPAIESWTFDPARQDIRMFWREGSATIGQFARLEQTIVRLGLRLEFAMNGGIYTADFAPLGLYIENGRTLHPLNTDRNRYGNFYLQPNGVFLVRVDGTAAICATADFRPDPAIRFATQSGPLLLRNNRINSIFRPDSANRLIRNGVGVRGDGRVVFAIATEPVNFYSFAAFFQKQGCPNALYLDGTVSQVYVAGRGAPLALSEFGVMIAVVSAPASGGR